MAIEPTPETGAITADQAIGILNARSAPAPQPEAAQPEAQPEPAAEAEVETPSEGEPPPEEAPELEEPTDQAEPEEGEADLPPIAAPQSWNAEAKEHFATLDRRSQEIILAREGDRDKAVQRSVQDAADARKVASEKTVEAQRVTNLVATLNQIVPVAQQVFQSKWSDWTPENQATLARADAAAYVARKAEFEAEVAVMTRMNNTRAEAQQVAHQQFVETETAKLAELEPALFDPKAGEGRRKALVDFMVKENVPVAEIPNLDANTLRLAYKAFLWDQSQAKARSAAQPVRTPAPASPAVRPAAAQPAPSRTRSVDAARERLSRTGSTDDAVALMRAQRQGR